MRFFKKEVKVRYVFAREAWRKEIDENPLEAVRKTIFNSVPHRDYIERGAHIVSEMFEDRLEGACNPGGFLRGMNLTMFGRKANRIYQLIASLPHRVGYGEHLRTMTTKIRDFLNDNECPDIDFEITTFFPCIFKRLPFAMICLRRF